MDDRFAAGMYSSGGSINFLGGIKYTTISNRPEGRRWLELVFARDSRNRLFTRCLLSVVCIYHHLAAHGGTYEHLIEGSKEGYVRKRRSSRCPLYSRSLADKSLRRL